MDSLILLEECVLKNNIFKHNMRYFEQHQGTAIWWRYTDDIFMIGLHGEEKLKEFLKMLKSFHPTLKSAAECSLDRVNILDVVVICCRNKLLTDLHIKPTDPHHYLEFSFYLVCHSKKSIPHSQALRFNRICSENKFFGK